MGGGLLARAMGLQQGLLRNLVSRSPLSLRTCSFTIASAATAGPKKILPQFSGSRFFAVSAHAVPVEVPKHETSTTMVQSLKEERKRRERLATTWFDYPVHSLETKEQTSTMKLATAVFQEPLRKDILNRVVLWQRAKRRTIARPAKTRAMVRGGGKKPWRQKGTGRARHGSIRSPIWVGGGKAHGPKPRTFEFDLPKKVRRLGLRVALSARMSEGKLTVVESEEISSHKTQHLNALLMKWDLSNILMITGKTVNENFKLAASNIVNLDYLPCHGSNVYSILKKSNLIVTVEAVEYLHKFLLRL